MNGAAVLKCDNIFQTLTWITLSYMCFLKNLFVLFWYKKGNCFVHVYAMSVNRNIYDIVSKPANFYWMFSRSRASLAPHSDMNEALVAFCLRSVFYVFRPPTTKNWATNCEMRVIFFYVGAHVQSKLREKMLFF